MNDDNLKPFNVRPPRERTEISRKGAAASNKKQKATKDISQIIQRVLYAPISHPKIKKMVDAMEIFPDDEEKNNLAALIITIYANGLKKGDRGVLRDLIELAGLKPADKIEITGKNEVNLEIKEYLLKRRENKKNNGNSNP